MTEKEKAILEKAEDIILKKMEHYEANIKDMGEKDIYNFQVLVITLGRIRTIQEGKTSVSMSI